MEPSDLTQVILPTGNRVLVKPFEADSVTPGGIVLPDSAKDKPTLGEVIAVGPGERNANGDYVGMPFSEGDTVFFRLYGGSEIEHDGETYKILNEGDILAVLKDVEDTALLDEDDDFDGYDDEEDD